MVQGLASLQGAVLLVWTHPEDGLHESSVQGLWSLHSGGGPPVQTPPAHESLVVHALPSSQAIVLLLCTHPDAGLHESFVQGLESSQFGADPPTHVPAEQ